MDLPGSTYHNNTIISLKKRFDPMDGFLLEKVESSQRIFENESRRFREVEMRRFPSFL
jgi:hypothetical protein